MKNSKLNLYFEENLIGSLVEDSQHRMEFAYAPTWLKSAKKFSISYSMPLREEPYSKEAQNYFANLLPEGDVRVAVAAKFGISSENDFRLLEALGGECAGALTIGQEPKALQSKYRALSTKKLKDIFDQGGSVFSAVQEEEEDIRLSLAGAQDKIPVYYEDGKLFLPQGNSPSSHILKLPSHRFKNLSENECLMGFFGKKMGLEMAMPKLLDIGGVNAYLVERYDRKKEEKKIIRLHQEDFCQALAYSHKVKYEKDGGPSFQECYQCVEGQSAFLPEDLERLVKWLIFNVLVGNCDAHAKNISFLMVEPDEWRLSPHYDIVSTKFYPKLSSKLAMTIGGSSDLGTVTGTHWARLAQDIKVGTKWLHQTVQEMSEKSTEVFKEACQEFSEIYGKSVVFQELEKIVTSQQRRLLSQLQK